MNQFRRELSARDRLSKMTEAEIAQVEAGLERLIKEEIENFEKASGRSFADVLAHVLADRWGQGLIVETDLQTAVRLYPAVAKPLSGYLPDTPWLKETAQTGVAPFRKKRRLEHWNEAEEARDEALKRWWPLNDKVREGTANNSERMEELIAFVELDAGSYPLDGSNSPLKSQLREERINGIASLVAHLANPRAVIADPWKLISIKSALPPMP